MRKVQMILRDKPKNLNAAKIEQKHMSVEGKQIRVAAYCRVSTEMESQQSSMEAQVRFFREQIQRHKGWELVGIYADEGISGGTAARRPEFQRLLRDCEEGKVDYIISKSISRFARNTLECLSIIRHLQSIGVQLIFEKENIDTGNAFSEMLLTVLAAFAQEESRSLSENQKWSIRKRFEEGDPRWHLLYGYRPGVGGAYYQIEETEAQVVREAFARYERGESFARIARTFNLAGYATPSAKTYRARRKDRMIQWNPASIHRMLTNEKYMGDYLMQKRYVVNHMTREEKKNDQSVLPSYYMRDQHPAIVPREQFERVMKIMKMKNSRSGPIQYPYDDKLVCPVCGERLIQRKMEMLEGRNAWRCERSEASCGMYILKTNILNDAILKAYRSVELDAVRSMLSTGEGEQKNAARTLLETKDRHRQFRKAEYYWVDDLIDRITFEQDRKLVVHWRCGEKTSVPLAIRHRRDNPLHLARAYQKRRQERDRMEGPKDGLEAIYNKEE